MISQLIASGDIRGKWGELTLLHTLGAHRRAAGGRRRAGQAGDFTLDRVRDLGANVARFLRRHGFADAATIAHGAGIAGLDADACAQAIAEGTLLGTLPLQPPQEARTTRPRELETLTIVEHDRRS